MKGRFRGRPVKRSMFSPRKPPSHARNTTTNTFEKGNNIKNIVVANACTSLARLSSGAHACKWVLKPKSKPRVVASRKFCSTPAARHLRPRCLAHRHPLRPPRRGTRTRLALWSWVRSEGADPAQPRPNAQIQPPEALRG